MLTDNSNLKTSVYILESAVGGLECVSVVKAKKSRPPPLCEEERFLGLQYESIFLNILIVHVGEKNFETDPKIASR